MSPNETDLDPEMNQEDSSEMIAGKKNIDRSLEEDLQMETLKWLEKAEALYCQVSGDEHFWRTSLPTSATPTISWKKRTSSELRSCDLGLAWMEIGWRGSVTAERVRSKPGTGRDVRPYPS